MILEKNPENSSKQETLTELEKELERFSCGKFSSANEEEEPEVYHSYNSNSQ